MNLAAYLAQGKSQDHLSGLAPDFAAALSRLLADAPNGVTINSGYRSPERQAQLWQEARAKYGSPEAARKWVAPPGRSQHNHGGAADLGYASPDVERWVHENAPKYGLNFRLGNEPWHIELGGADAGHAVAGSSGMVGPDLDAAGTPAPGPDMPAPDPRAALAGLLASATQTPAPAQDARRSLTPVPGLIVQQTPLSLAQLLAEFDTLGGPGLG